MTEREARIRRAVSLAETAFPAGAAGWARARKEAWVDAVIDQEPEDVEHAAAELVRTWHAHNRPFPGHLRDLALAARSAAGRVRVVPGGDPGEGCPRCEEAGARGKWVCDRKARIVHCREHGIGWRGLLPERAGDGPGHRETPAPHWHGLLWSAAMYAAMRERRPDAAVPARLAPYLAICDDLGLRPEHGVPENPGWRPSIAAAALEAAEAAWREHGGAAGVGELVGAAREGTRWGE